jgi:hypothetical protein
MPNKVRIIAQSKIYNVAKEVEEKDAEKELEELARMYEALRINNGILQEEDEGLLVTTHLIKE